MPMHSHSVSGRLRYVTVRLLLGLAAGTTSYFLLLWLYGPWEGIVAAALIGCVVGVAYRSLQRVLVEGAAYAAGWLLCSLLLSFWIERRGVG